jgi:hypothetical protein
MTLTFYPHEDHLETSSLSEKLEALMDAAELYKATVLDLETKKEVASSTKRSVPKDLQMAYNWDEIVGVLHEIRELPEATPVNKNAKADSLTKLAEIYEVLRSAKMPKLEAVRVALVAEAAQLHVVIPQ